jgi:hypothetical protein
VHERVRAGEVVEHPVQADPDAARVRLGQQVLEVSLVPEPGVDPFMVEGVVAVAERGEHRGEHQPVAAEFEQVVEPADQPGQPVGDLRDGLALGVHEPQRVDVPPDDVRRPVHLIPPRPTLGEPAPAVQKNPAPRLALGLIEC